jgi:hypothetical protein
LSEKERWKEWHKAKDAERKAGLAARDHCLGLKANKKQTGRHRDIAPTFTGRRADGLGGWDRCCRIHMTSSHNTTCHSPCNDQIPFTYEIRRLLLSINVLCLRLTILLC